MLALQSISVINVANSKLKAVSNSGNKKTTFHWDPVRSTQETLIHWALQISIAIKMDDMFVSWILKRALYKFEESESYFISPG
jgi:hypothetical protein